MLTTGVLSREIVDAKTTRAEKVLEEHEVEDEESDKEQISSALYYPHQAPSPDALQDLSIEDARKKKEVGHCIVAPLVYLPCYESLSEV